MIAALLLAVLTGSQQLIVVTTPDWNATSGKLQRYEKRLLRWRAAGPPVDVVIGRTGLAWGRGLHSPQNGTQKREGDGKAPAGVFALGTSFGFASTAGWKLPYLQLHETTECVDDAASTFYDQIVERTPAADWTSSEKMRSIGLYKWGAVVSHNAPPAPGAGSCIFLHVGAKPTAGCTAMAESDLVTLLQWLDPKKSPRMVQLPVDEYARLKREWQLP